MSRNSSSWEVDQVGLSCANKEKDAERWTKRSCSINPGYKTIGWLT